MSTNRKVGLALLAFAVIGSAIAVPEVLFSWQGLLMILGYSGLVFSLTDDDKK